jgi:hypothetical protein
VRGTPHSGIPVLAFALDQQQVTSFHIDSLVSGVELIFNCHSVRNSWSLYQLASTNV